MIRILTLALLFGCSSLSARAQEIRAAECVIVLDAEDQVVGRADIDLNGPTVLLDTSRGLTWVEVRTDRFGWPGHGPWFASTDCTGLRVLRDNLRTDETAMVSESFVDEDQVLWLPDFDEPTQDLMAVSWVRDDGTCELRAYPSPVSVRPAVAVGDLDETFTPPYRAESRDCASGDHPGRGHGPRRPERP